MTEIALPFSSYRNHFQVIERAQGYDWDHYLQCPKGGNSKRSNSVMVLVFYISCHGDKHLHKVLSSCGHGT